jgi:hypothetical protein
MASPRISYPSQSTPLAWTSGDLFNGFVLIGLALPTSSGTAFLGVRYGNAGISEAIPQFTKIPVKDGLLNSSCGLFYNADLTPPASIYYAWIYVPNGPTAGGVCRMIAGPSASFSVTAPTFEIPALTLTVPTVGTQPTPDVAAPPGGSYVTLVSFQTYPATETPDGVETDFTFSFLPSAVLYNGQMRFENNGYLRAGYVIQLIDDAGDVFAPESTATVRAFL